MTYPSFSFVSDSRLRLALEQLRDIVNGDGVMGQRLGQLRPSGTTAAAVYTAPGSRRTRVAQLIICNQTGTAAVYRVFHDEVGTTFDETTALFYDVSLAANATIVLDLKVEVKAGGSIGVRTGTGNALTFSLYGEEVVNAS